MGHHRLPLDPFLPLEAEAQASGYCCIAGLDEAGRGPLAGPVVAAAVMLSADRPIPGLRDSKRLSPQQRYTVYRAILQQAVAWGIGIVPHVQIDQHDVLWATKEAMIRAVRQLPWAPDLLLIDGTVSLPLPIAQRTVVRGDACCASIAAASVLAKVIRDRLMVAYATRYPEYGFDKHKGYPTREHYACLQKYGPCAIHRRSFRGVVPNEAG